MGGTSQRFFKQLSALKVDRLKTPGYYLDGGGLYLQVSKAGTKSWIFRFTLNGRPREMGLGSRHILSLADARERASVCRKLLLDGVDPIEARNQRRSEARLTAARSMTFANCATAYIEAHRSGWNNAKHVSQWENTLATYAGPVFGSLPVQAVDTHLVTKALQTIWTAKPETASRLRGRVEAVLDWAKVRGLRTGDNPARWRGHLDKLLPKRSKARGVRHHAALPYVNMGAFMIELREQPGIAARALEFTILTAARTGETTGATADEFMLDQKLWTIPASRMKAGIEHRVPLTERAVAIVDDMHAGQHGAFVFRGGKAGKPLSNMAMLALLKRMGRPDITVHGFRSAFRDWSAEQTNYPREVAEAALAHQLDDRVEAAYRRGDLFEKRRRLMNDWSKYCDTKPAGNVLPIRKRV